MLKLTEIMGLIPIVDIYMLFAVSRMLYQCLFGFMYLTKVPKKARNLLREPLVSVLIPAWNEEVGILKTVQSVLNGKYKRVEVIVIDDGSTDRTVELVRRAYAHDKRVKLIADGHRGKAGALNRGLVDARGEFALTLDADSYLTRRSIDDMVRVLVANDHYDAAIGEIVIGNTRHLLGMAQYYEYLVGFHYKRKQYVFQSSFIFPGALTMFRRKIVNQVGLFDSGTVTEDLNYSMRVRKSGGKVAYVDSAVCITEGAGTLKGLFNQRVRWRHGFVKCLSNDPHFTFSIKKGWYLSLIELPFALLGVLQVFFLPLIISVLMWVLFFRPSAVPWPFIAMWFFLLPIMITLIGAIGAHGVYRHKRPPLLTFLIIPFLFAFIDLVEFVALIKVIWLVIRGKQSAWQRWQRKGADA